MLDIILFVLIKWFQSYIIYIENSIFYAYLFIHLNVYLAKNIFI